MNENLSEMKNSCVLIKVSNLLIDNKVSVSKFAR